MSYLKSIGKIKQYIDSVETVSISNILKIIKNEKVIEDLVEYLTETCILMNQLHFNPSYEVSVYSTILRTYLVEMKGNTAVLPFDMQFTIDTIYKVLKTCKKNEEFMRYLSESMLNVISEKCSGNKTFEPPPSGISGSILCKILYTNELVLVKSCKTSCSNEITILRKLKGFNDHELDKYISYPLLIIGDYVLIYKYDENICDLIDYIGKIDIEDLNEYTYHCLSLCIMMAHAVCKLHEHNILHLDIKPDNIIINETVIALIDFGFSLSVDVAFHTPVTFGTQYYLNPPIKNPVGGTYHFPPYTKKTDVYALGITFLILLNKNLSMGSIPTGSKPEDYIKRNTIYKREITRYTFFTDPHKNTLLKNLLLNMIDIDPEKRPSCETIILELGTACSPR